jgi:superfamily II DNA/RNA helicase
MEELKTSKDKQTKGTAKVDTPEKIEDDSEMIIETSEELVVVKSFDELGLREELLRGILAYGFNKPSAV